MMANAYFVIQAGPTRPAEFAIDKLTRLVDAAMRAGATLQGGLVVLEASDGRGIVAFQAVTYPLEKANEFAMSQRTAIDPDWEAGRLAGYAR